MSVNVQYKQIKELCGEFYSEMDKLITDLFCDSDIENAKYFDDLKEYLFGSSKQIRSCMVFLFAQNLGYTLKDKDIIKLATAVEIIHNATLIHDDIIDETDLRRGNKTIHKKYNSKLGVISGDFLLSVAFSLLVDLPVCVMKNFSVCLKLLCSGEIEQYFSLKKTTTIEKYLNKSEKKTSALFVSAIKSLFDMKSQSLSSEAENFALHFGRAFQIRDDLKNILLKQDNKPVLNDIEQGIYTAPVIFAYGENKELSGVLSETIMQESMTNIPVCKTKELLKQEINGAVMSLALFKQNKYLDAIKILCEMLDD